MVTGPEVIRFCGYGWIDKAIAIDVGKRADLMTIMRIKFYFQARMLEGCQKRTLLKC